MDQVVSGSGWAFAVAVIDVLGGEPFEDGVRPHHRAEQRCIGQERARVGIGSRACIVLRLRLGISGRWGVSCPKRFTSFESPLA